MADTDTRESIARYTAQINFFDEPAVKEEVERIAREERVSASTVYREALSLGLEQRAQRASA